ncbi:hypothetical protein JCM1393_17410 [Clostridium carnis]
MKKVKILQCGDMHFDTPFKDLNKELSYFSKEELLEVFGKVIDLCKENSVDILLLTGDIFDNITVNKKTLIFIKNQIERIINIKVFISPGNHDPYNENSFYKLVEWPRNVYIFKKEVEKVIIDDLKVVVWGAAFNTSHIKESLLKKIERIEDYINIGVIHGDITSSEGGNDYNPITLKDIRDSNLDYIAIGHRHGYSGILREGNTCYAYAGCPQGRGFDELGDKGVIIGDISNGVVDLKFIRTSKRNYYVNNVDISGAMSYEEVKNKIISSIEKKDRQLNFYKIILNGYLESHIQLKEEVILEKIKEEFYFVKVIDKTEVKIDLDEMAKGYSIKGIFASKILKELELANEEEKEVLNLALKLGVQCLSEEEVNLNDY